MDYNGILTVRSSGLNVFPLYQKGTVDVSVAYGRLVVKPDSRAVYSLLLARSMVSNAMLCRQIRLKFIVVIEAPSASRRER